MQQSDIELKQLKTEISALNEAVKHLQSQLTVRYQVSLDLMQAEGFVGQSVAIKVSVKVARSGLPAAGVRLVLATNWGEVIYRHGMEVKQAGTISVITDSYGSVRIKLTSPLAKRLSGQQQVALESALNVLDKSAETVSECEAGFNQLIERYGNTNDLDFHNAVDIYFREYKEKLTDSIHSTLGQQHWCYENAMIFAFVQQENSKAGLASGNTLESSCVLSLRFREWLSPWYQAYMNDLDARSSLAEEFENIKTSTSDAGHMRNRILGEVNFFTAGQRGLVAESAARGVAERSIQGFLAAGMADLSEDNKSALIPSLDIALKNIRASGMALHPAEDQIRNELINEVGVRINKLGNNDMLAEKFANMENVMNEMGKPDWLSGKLNNMDPAMLPAGMRGKDGVNGKDGLTGIDGAKGSRGNIGTPGINGKDGLKGIDGLSGKDGIDGVRGPRGNIGVPGVNGKDGLKGIDGLSGKDGIDGVRGSRGNNGASGVDGKDGAPGSQGIQGMKGVAGARGLKGSTGARGLKGVTGAQGARGIQGVKGAAGARGLKGSTGARGLKGVTGAQGARGMQGVKGTAGAKGLKGATGARGLKGVTGAKGRQGIQGIQGPKVEIATPLNINTRLIR